MSWYGYAYTDVSGLQWVQVGEREMSSGWAGVGLVDVGRRGLACVSFGGRWKVKVCLGGWWCVLAGVGGLAWGRQAGGGRR